LENSSGQGPGSEVPIEIRRWNWAAFFFNWIWGLGNSVYISLLMFIPGVNLIIPFVLGAKGSTWAWQNQKWESVEAFRREQRMWLIIGFSIILGFALFISGFVYFIGSIMKSSDAYQISLDQIQNHPQVIETLGKPIEAGFFVSGSVSIQNSTGNADISYNIEGPKATGKAYVEANKEKGQWLFQSIVVEVNPDGQRIVLVGD